MEHHCFLSDGSWQDCGSNLVSILNPFQIVASYARHVNRSTTKGWSWARIPGRLAHGAAGLHALVNPVGDPRPGGVAAFRPQNKAERGKAGTRTRGAQTAPRNGT